MNCSEIDQHISEAQYLFLYRSLYILALKSTYLMNIYDSIRQGKLMEVKAIVSQDMKAASQTDARGFTPLIMACYLGQLQIVEYLLDQGVNINAKDSAGNTALMGICFKGNLEIASLLLYKGADVNIKNKDEVDALTYATKYGHDAIVSLLQSSMDKS